MTSSETPLTCVDFIDADLLLDKLGGLPLALVQAGADVIETDSEAGRSECSADQRPGFYRLRIVEEARSSPHDSIPPLADAARRRYAAPQDDVRRARPVNKLHSHGQVVLPLRRLGEASIHNCATSAART